MRKLYPHNPVYLHPEDLTSLGIAPGDVLVIKRGDAAVGGFAKADESLRRGTVAMSHGWSGRPTHPWEATNALVDLDDGAQAINGMPVMTGVAVEVFVMPR
jgi:anaerobic selenocysteine-containing dehydrogenase